MICFKLKAIRKRKIEKHTVVSDFLQKKKKNKIILSIVFSTTGFLQNTLGVL